LLELPGARSRPQRRVVAADGRVAAEVVIMVVDGARGSNPGLSLGSGSHRVGAPTKITTS